jgi:NAD(P)H-hydrate epimerase
MDAWWPLLPPRTILTPHPGEMARLLKLKPTDDGETAIAQIQRDRLNITTAKAAEWNCVVVLKGAYTVIADPAGRAAVIPISEPALARAGTGDVLAGMIVGLLAQGLDAFDAAVAATYIHARAGQSAASLLGTRTSVLATDVIGRLPATFAEIEALRA